MKNEKANEVVSPKEFEDQNFESWQRIREDLPGYLDMMGARGHFMIVMARDDKDGKILGQTIMHGDLQAIGGSLLTACRQYPELLYIVKYIAKKL